MLTIGSLIVKSTLVLAVAALAALGMRRRSAAARHMVWSIALTSALVLPLLSAVAPAWRVTVPGLPRTLSEEVVPAPVSVSSPASPRELVWEPTTASSQASSKDVVTGSAGAAQPPIVAVATDQTATRPSRFSFARLAALAWILGAVILLGHTLLAIVVVARIARRATPVEDDPHLRRLLADVMCRCALHDVELRMSHEIDLPATWGLTRPIVLVPAEASEWTIDRWTLVLEHELAHVDRRDVWMHIVARAARAVHWINPLAWYAERELRLETEQACDDAVLARGVRPTTYAEQLLEIARPFGAPAAALLAPGFATKHIERRLSALLDARVPRRIRSRLDAALIGVGVIVLAAPLAAMRPVDAPQQRVDRSATPSNPVAPRAALPQPVMDPSPVAPPEIDPAEMQQPETCVPDGGSSSNMSSDNGAVRRWEVHWTGRDCAVDLRAQGKVDFTDNLDDVRAITPGGWLDISVRSGDHLRRFVVRPRDDGALDRRLTLDGAAQPWDDGARRWFGGFLVDIDRRTAFAVDTRLPRLLAQGGPNAVLDEVGRMSGDYARGVYLKRLMDAASLDRAQVRRVIDLAGTGMKSDYEIAQVLTAVANKYGLPDADTRKAFLAAVDAIHSDYEHNRTLHALLDRSQPTEAEAGAILASASKLQSDYELSRTLVDLVGRKLVTPGLFDTYLADAARIHSDYERSRSLRALLGMAHLSDAQVGKVIAAASTIQSDYEKANVLTTVANGYDLKGDLRSEYERAAQSIHSDYERGRTLAAVRSARAS